MTTAKLPVVFKGVEKAAGLTAYAYSWKPKKTEAEEEKCTESQACCESPANTVKDQQVRQVAIDVPRSAARKSPVNG